MPDHDFSRDHLLTTLQDAEELAARIEDLPEGQQQMQSDLSLGRDRRQSCTVNGTSGRAVACRRTGKFTRYRQ